MTLGERQIGSKLLASFSSILLLNTGHTANNTTNLREQDRVEAFVPGGICVHIPHFDIIEKRV